VQKDPLPISAQRNVVYKIACKDCEASYVGQTSRQLHTHILEHRNHIRRNMFSHSVIIDHRLQFDHEFDWDKAQVLDIERNYNKRLTSEILYIKIQKRSLNLQTKTEFLDHVRQNFLNTI